MSSLRESLMNMEAPRFERRIFFVPPWFIDHLRANDPEFRRLEQWAKEQEDSSLPPQD